MIPGGRSATSDADTALDVLTAPFFSWSALWRLAPTFRFAING